MPVPTTLVNAIRNHNNNKVRRMLQNGRFDVNDIYNNCSLLHIAVQSQNKHVVTMLLEHGANPNTGVGNEDFANIKFPGCDVTPLALAFTDRSAQEIVSILLDHGAKFTEGCDEIPYSQGFKAIYDMSKDDDEEYKVIFWAVPLLIEKGGMDINSCRDDGDTLLTLAVDISDDSQVSDNYKADLYAMVEELLKHGADPNIPGKGGKYAVQIAKENNRHDIVTLLLKNKAVAMPGIEYCKVCCRADIPVSKCTGCYSAEYCSKECQKIDWKNGHKAECQKQNGQCKSKTSLLSEID